MKKQWISVKCGLSRDPKHRQAMGESVWLFLHILDIASWDDGIAHDWKDEAAAEDMGMPVRTLREHRRRLAELGYIACNQKQYTQDIVIHNWTNPREYNGQVYNQKQGDSETEPHQGDTQGYIQGSRKDVTPTSNSKNQRNKDIVLSKQDLADVNKKVNSIIAGSKPQLWQGRELLRDNLLVLADWYNKVTGQEMTKRVQKTWYKALQDWSDEGIQPEHLQIAYDTQSKWRVVNDPNQLTKDACAIKASGAKSSTILPVTYNTEGMPESW